MRPVDCPPPDDLSYLDPPSDLMPHYKPLCPTLGQQRFVKIKTIVQKTLRFSRMQRPVRIGVLCLSHSPPTTGCGDAGLGIRDSETTCMECRRPRLGGPVQASVFRLSFRRSPVRGTVCRLSRRRSERAPTPRAGPTRRHRRLAGRPYRCAASRGPPDSSARRHL